MATFVHTPVYRLDPPNEPATEEDSGPRPTEDLGSDMSNTLPPTAPVPTPPPLSDTVPISDDIPMSDRIPPNPQRRNEPPALPNPRLSDVLHKDIPSAVLQRPRFSNNSLPEIHQYEQDMETDEIINENWHERKNWRYAGILAFMVVFADLAMIGTAFWLQQAMYAGAAIAGVGLVTFIGVLFATNRLSNAPDLDKGEFRKALTAAFVIVYFTLIGLSASNRFDPSANAFMMQLTDHFIWLIGMIVGAYFLSSGVRDWQSKVQNVLEEEVEG